MFKLSSNTPDSKLVYTV